MAIPDEAPSVIVVVGAGLAGLGAAISAAEAAQASGLTSPRVVLLEKVAGVGGNSAKASSGINALHIAAGDSEALFAKDTTASGGGLSKPALVETLVGQSTSAKEFLSSLGLDLSRVCLLGGHSVPRSFSNPTGPNVGLAIIKAASARVEQLPNIQLRTGIHVTGLKAADESLGNGGGLVVTVQESAATGEAAPPPEQLHAAAVVLATGGFAASRELLERYSPVAAQLATTNGPWATGDGLELGTSLGAALLHMEQVQIHPTGFVDPTAPDALTKWLAPERLRGCGALLLDLTGHRFADEMQRRDVMSARMMELQPSHQAWLYLGAAAAKEYGEGPLGFYCFKGMMRKADNTSHAAELMGVPAEVLQRELAAYAAAAGGGAGAADAFGKTVFPNPPAGDEGPIYLALVTPVVHYCMGGLEVDEQAHVLAADGTPVPGLFAAGEVSGGLHGKNRLGGNSLAECAVFGRIAGRSALQYATGSTPKV